MNDETTGSPTDGTAELPSPSNSCEDTVPPLRENEKEITLEVLSLVQSSAKSFAQDYATKARFAKLRKVRRLNLERARVLMGFDNYIEHLKDEFLESIEDVD